MPGGRLSPEIHLDSPDPLAPTGSRIRSSMQAEPACPPAADRQLPSTQLRLRERDDILARRPSYYHPRYTEARRNAVAAALRLIPRESVLRLANLGVVAGMLHMSRQRMILQSLR